MKTFSYVRFRAQSQGPYTVQKTVFLHLEVSGVCALRCVVIRVQPQPATDLYKLLPTAVCKTPLIPRCSNMLILFGSLCSCERVLKAELHFKKEKKNSPLKEKKRAAVTSILTFILELSPAVIHFFH